MVAKAYYTLTKPGIIRGNLITAAGGFLLAARGVIDWRLFLYTLLGMAFVIASACVINNYIDRGIDAKMARTKTRASVTGNISYKNAMIFAAALGIMGVITLSLKVSILALSLAVLGFVVYVAAYGLAKRRSVYGTEVGAVAGAVPITVGYVAAAGVLDIGAAILFMILFIWQMPHFYAIAMFRFDDYKSAGLPVMPVKKGMHTTKLYIVAYVLAFTFTATLLTIFGYAGTLYLLGMIALGGVWLVIGLQGFTANNDAEWARKMFRFSLIVIALFSVLISIDFILP